MKLKWMVNSLVLILFCLTVFFGLAHRDSAVAAGDGNEKIETILIDKITADGSADFIVRFTVQADLSAAYSMDWNARGEFVYNTLRETAEQGQATAKSTLNAQGLPYQTFIAGNELYVWGKKQAVTNSADALTELTILNTLAALPEVTSIQATHTYTIDPVVEVKPLENITWAGDYLAYNTLTTVNNSTNATVDWGITDTKANLFWSTFGMKGGGIKVANIDTGVQWNHPALINQFACLGNPGNPACWYDPSHICSGGTACDNNGHGTHTMGTMVAKDDPALLYIAGMAPDATWIACKGCESSTCSEFALKACADWILAPDGDPANRPNVVNNSWGDTGGNNWFQTRVQAWRAAGIFPAFSAGNSGPGCSTLGSPGDYQESFSSAAHDKFRKIASFSSRGPSSFFGHEPYTKPNLSAPGVNICSTVPNNYWSCGYSGTSMASPHTAGAVALLWSCNPALVGMVDATFQLLQNNTDSAPVGSCSAPPDGFGNNTYGYGYLNVLSAGLVTCNGPKGTLNGHIYGANGVPIAGAKISFVLSIPSNQAETISESNSSVNDKDSNQNGGAIISATSDNNSNQIQGFTDLTGFYSFNLWKGTYSVSAQKTGYDLKSTSGIAITEGITTTANFTLTQHNELYIPVVFRPNPNETLINNGDFEQGHVAWTETSSNGYKLILQPPDLIVTPHDGNWAVWLGGWDDEISSIQQQVVVPAGYPYLSYWHWIGSQEQLCQYDFGEVIVNSAVVEKYYLCVPNNSNGWVKRVVNLSAYAGQSVSLQIYAETNASINSNLFIDHVAFQSTSTSENPSAAPVFGIDANLPKTDTLK
jgi:hypothetical protein